MDEIVEITTILVRSAHTVDKMYTNSNINSKPNTYTWMECNQQQQQQKIRCDMKWNE